MRHRIIRTWFFCVVVISSVLVGRLFPCAFADDPSFSTLFHQPQSKSLPGISEPLMKAMLGENSRENRLLHLLYDGQADYSFAVRVKQAWEEAGANKNNYEFTRMTNVMQNAIESFSQVIALDPTYWYAYLYRGFCHEVIEEDDLALADYRKVIELQPQIAEAWGNVGFYLMMQGQFDEALKYYQQARSLQPLRTEFPLKSGHLYLLTGDQEAARECYQQALTLLWKAEPFFQAGPEKDLALFRNPGWPEDLYRQELTWMRQEFSAILTRFHDNFASYVEQAESPGHKLLRQGKFDDAEAWVRQHLNDCWLWQPRGELSADCRRKYMLLAHLSLVRDEDFISVSSSAPKVSYWNLIRQIFTQIESEKEIWGMMRDLEFFIANDWKAERIQETLSALEFEFYLYYRFVLQANQTMNQADSFVKQQNYEEALRLYTHGAEIEKASRLPRLDWLALLANKTYRIAVERFQEQDYATAIQFSEFAQTCDMFNPQLYLTILAQAHHRQGDYQQALAYYEQIIPLARASGAQQHLAHYLHLAAQVYEHLGQHEKAAAYYQESLETVQVDLDNANQEKSPRPAEIDTW